MEQEVVVLAELVVEAEVEEVLVVEDGEEAAPLSPAARYGRGPAAALRGAWGAAGPPPPAPPTCAAHS